jgi:hypothetical protein
MAITFPKFEMTTPHFPPRKLASALFGAFAIVFGCCFSAQATTIVLNPIQDNSIYSESNNSNALGGLFTGETANGDLRRALMEFDIADNIPAGSIIDSVSLTLTQTKIGPASSATFELNSVNAAWGQGTSSGIGAGGIATQGDATWNFRLFNTNSWTSPGGDFRSLASGTTTIGTTLGNYTFASQSGLVSDVQNWLDNSGSNFGWILSAADESIGNTTARELGSTESSVADRPTLTINFTAVPEPSTCALGITGLFAILIAARWPGKPPEAR